MDHESTGHSFSKKKHEKSPDLALIKPAQLSGHENAIFNCYPVPTSSSWLKFICSAYIIVYFIGICQDCKCCPIKKNLKNEDQTLKNLQNYFQGRVFYEKNTVSKCKTLLEMFRVKNKS
jgi:hypothetical protein